jgi:L,D-transpeptidase YcbB
VKIYTAGRQGRQGRQGIDDKISVFLTFELSLEANLERWRWLSDDLGKCYIRVNIADFSLQVIEDDKQVLQSVAVVGCPYKQTPVFSSMLKYLVLNPD